MTPTTQPYEPSATASGQADEQSQSGHHRAEHQERAGENGFSALGGLQQAGTTCGTDLEPPDQGLCAGDGYVMEFINNALAIYTGYGAQLVAPVGSASAFRQPTTDFFSNPRCYYDTPTKHWLFQEFIVGTATTPSTQFEAISKTADPTGTHTVYSWDTNDTSTAGCPCFGDYDQFGADDNGIYVATDEFGISSSAFNGTVIYAVSKEQIENAATTGVLPPVFGYRLTQDSFGQPYIVAPTSTPPGPKFAPGDRGDPRGRPRRRLHLLRRLRRPQLRWLPLG